MKISTINILLIGLAFLSIPAFSSISDRETSNDVIIKDTAHEVEEIHCKLLELIAMNKKAIRAQKLSKDSNAPSKYILFQQKKKIRNELREVDLMKKKLDVYQEELQTRRSADKSLIGASLIIDLIEINENLITKSLGEINQSQIKLKKYYQKQFPIVFGGSNFIR